MWPPAFALPASLAFVSGVVSASTPVPTQLFSPLVGQKLSATASNIASLQKNGTANIYPQYTTRDNGQWDLFSPNTWTSGFFPGTMYLMAQRSLLCPKSSSVSEAQWLSWGRDESQGLVPIETHNTVEHDVGFIAFPFRSELELNPGNKSAQTAVIDFAAELAARFNYKVGCTRSWDTSDPTLFQVIIDNMMNLDVLFASNALKPNRTLVNMAISHADKTRVNHIRADGGSFHVVEYNATTGAVIDRKTSQGYANNSTWSRGQAWGVYGFAKMYENTKLERFLDTSQKMANYFLTHLPSNGIVPWDFNAPTTPPRPADTSAATIMANGLMLLSQLVSDSALKQKYMNASLSILTSTIGLAWNATWGGSQWASLLSNGTVNNPVGNNLTGTVYGDYYFVRAGNELVKAGLAKC